MRAVLACSLQASGFLDQRRGHGVATVAIHGAMARHGANKPTTALCVKLLQQAVGPRHNGLDQTCQQSSATWTLNCGVAVYLDEASGLQYFSVGFGSWAPFVQLLCGTLCYVILRRCLATVPPIAVLWAKLHSKAHSVHLSAAPRWPSSALSSPMCPCGSFHTGRHPLRASRPSWPNWLR